MRVRKGLKPIAFAIKKMGLSVPERRRLIKRAPEIAEFLGGFVPRTNQDLALKARVLALASDDAIIRAKAVNELRKFKDQRVIEPLSAMLKDPFLEVRIQTIYSLGALANPKTEALLRGLLTDKEPNIRWAAAFALGNFKTEVVLESLIKVAVKDETTGVRAMATQALGNFLEYPAAKKALENLVNDPDGVVAAQAQYALAFKKK